MVFAARRPVICDFDDAIFHRYDVHSSYLVRTILGEKLAPLLRGAALCICGNAYLGSYAARFCTRTEIVPTVLDTSVYVPSQCSRNGELPLTVGWIGSPSTWGYVKPLVPLLGRLGDELNLRFLIVGAGTAMENDRRFEYAEWSEGTEIQLLQCMDIGIMPLTDEAWAQGKCGYKLIQYMACGIPVIASPVGVNCQIVEDGCNGYLAKNEYEWERSIRRLACDEQARVRMGENGRDRAVNNYSSHTYGPIIANLLLAVHDRACFVGS